MMIDCDACAARGPACGDCVVTVLLGLPPVGRPGDVSEAIDLDAPVQAAIAVLAECGLIPPLRLVPATPESHDQHDQNRSSRGAKYADPHYPDNRPGDDQRTAV
jgi:hypothetical protein